MNQSENLNKSEILKRILIVEDHPVVRFGLATVLKQHGGYLVCGEAVDHQEALSKIREFNPDLVTVDLNLKQNHPRTRKDSTVPLDFTGELWRSSQNPI